MFNRKYKRDLRLLEGVVEDLEDRLNSIEVVNEKLDHVLVDNYFKDCPCCRGEGDKILKKDAREFIALAYSWDRSIPVNEVYCTAKAYKVHREGIAEIEGRAKRYLKKLN